ncbi:telomeric repeat-binding factor 1 [Pelodytes ibericus]
MMKEAAGVATKELLFDDVAKVATDWMFDFTFNSMRYYFKEDRTEDFQRACKIMEVLLEGMPALDTDKTKVVLISQFLTRVAEGKCLDAQFELDERLTPLESAALVLEQIEETEEDLRNLYKEITCFVKVQAVAICMEKGKFKMSSEVLERQFQETGSNNYLKMKLAMIISKKDPYHEFLQNFSYDKMLTKIKTYIDLAFKERTPAFLLTAATRVVEAKAELAKGIQNGKQGDISLHNNERQEVDEVSISSEDTMVYSRQRQSTDSTPAEMEKANSSSGNESTTVLEDINITTDLNRNKMNLDDRKEVTGDTCKSTERCHKRLLSLESHTPWNPDQQSLSQKLKRNMKLGKMNQEKNENVESVKTSSPSNCAAPKKRQHWTWEEDELLKKGVTKYGVGNWRKILVHYEFNNRTGVMLKDRWRTMKKLNIVG